MSEGKGQRKFPIPEGFVWNFPRNLYVHPDGRSWDPDINVIMPGPGADPRQIEGGGPRILPADVEATIKSVKYIVEDTLTICVITLQNGYRVTGESACADPANFNQAKGEELARKAACEKIWPLLGYTLRDRLHQQEG